MLSALVACRGVPRLVSRDASRLMSGTAGKPTVLAPTSNAAPSSTAAEQSQRSASSEADDWNDDEYEPDHNVGPPPKLGVLGGVLAAVLGAGGYSLYRGYEARSWPVVQGKVAITASYLLSLASLHSSLHR